MRIIKNHASNTQERHVRLSSYLSQARGYRERSPQSINSWEDIEGECGMHGEQDEGDEDAAKRALDQLVELGYMDKPSDKDEDNRKKATDECNFNLAKAYMDGGKLEEALRLLEVLYELEPNIPRIAFHLAVCYQSLGKLKDCRSIIETIRTHTTSWDWHSKA